jgi:hypothetical protein
LLSTDCPPDPSEFWIQCVDFEDLRLAKNDLDGSRPCLIGSLGDGGYGGIAVRLIPVPIDGFGEPGATSVFSEMNGDRAVTGRIDASFK